MRPTDKSRVVRVLTAVAIVAVASAVTATVFVRSEAGLRSLRGSRLASSSPAPPSSSESVLEPAPPRRVPSSASVASYDAAVRTSAVESSGRILTDASESEHRIFVDGRALGQGGAPLIVRCGRHMVRVGTAGAAVAVDVPCGGDVRVTRDGTATRPSVDPPRAGGGPRSGTPSEPR